MLKLIGFTERCFGIMDAQKNYFNLEVNLEYYVSHNNYYFKSYRNLLDYG